MSTVEECDAGICREATALNKRCPASFALLTATNTARVASRVGHLERYMTCVLRWDSEDQG
jgi:hypothetical protein